MLDYDIFKLRLHQEFVGGEIGSIGQLATAKFLNCRCRIRVDAVEKYPAVVDHFFKRNMLCAAS